MRNFTRLCIFLLFFPCFWSGCNDRSVRHRMLEAEARFDTVPSDIFRLLSEVGSPDSLSSEDRALYDLLTLRSYSIRGKPLPDSLVRHVYAYYHATDDSLHRARASLYMSRLHYKSRSHFRQWLLPLLEAERYAPTDNLLLRGQISSDMGAVYEMQYEDELASTSIAGPTRFSNGWDGWICRFGPPVVRGTCTFTCTATTAPDIISGRDFGYPGFSAIRPCSRILNTV